MKKFRKIVLMVVLTLCMGCAKQEVNIKEDKILILYFSVTGTTKEVAEKISEELDADLFEIVCKEPYTEKDIDYTDANSRAYKEQKDDSSRPAIADMVDLSKYDTIFIGHPIWFSKEPRIIDTLMENYDFSNKNIAHFCTSGGSGIETSDNNIKAYVKDANWLGSRCIKDKDEICDWLKELGVK
ncbi:MAG: flavodoxin [Holdemanella sp.]|nr:flavodoxin [Holdemanella sp.]